MWRSTKIEIITVTQVCLLFYPLPVAPIGLVEALDGWPLFVIAQVKSFK